MRPDSHYKEQNPEATVRQIQEILARLNLETEEHWLPESSAATCSLRLTIKGTDIGTNGKGVSRAYARASAYGEFMERLQNNFLVIFEGNHRKEDGFEHFPDEKFLTSAQLGDLKHGMMETFFSISGLNEKSGEERADFIRKYHKIDFFLDGRIDSYETHPFYSLKEKRDVDVPYYLCMMLYGSNGMCAGNTPAEALVQGLSEIIERHVQEKILLENPVLPDIPDAYIRKYPYIWQRVEMLRNLPGLTISMKDCSFGGKYPVAALLINEKNTGRFGLKLGCHPDYGVAMERAITESAQGGDFFDYATRSRLDFSNKDVSSGANICFSYKMGYGNFPYQLFGSKPDWEFTPVPDVSGKDNTSILKDMVDSLLADGYDVMIRNTSWLGFPAYHILVPGMSEIMRECSPLFLKVYNSKMYLMERLKNPEILTGKDVRLIRGVLDFLAQKKLNTSISSLFGTSDDRRFPAEELGLGWLYLTAMCCFYLQEYQEAAERMKNIATAAEKVEGSNTPFYTAVYYYFSAKSQGFSDEKTEEYLRKLFDDNILKKVRFCLGDEKKVLIRQYTLDTGTDFAGDPGQDIIWQKVRKKLKTKMKEMGKLSFSFGSKEE